MTSWIYSFFGWAELHMVSIISMFAWFVMGWLLEVSKSR
ncbi:hypothetical protein JOD82_002019 [Paenibacillus sp. 1182]|nr:hypothetical protein [Paenibacillus sp. 1182]